MRHLTSETLIFWSCEASAFVALKMLFIICRFENDFLTIVVLQMTFNSVTIVKMSLAVHLLLIIYHVVPSFEALLFGPCDKFHEDFLVKFMRIFISLLRKVFHICVTYRNT